VKPKATVHFDGGPLDGLELDWTHAGKFPAKLRLTFAECQMESGQETEVVYEALHFWQEGETLSDGMPQTECQSYRLAKTGRRESQSLRELWDETQPAEEDDRQQGTG